MNGGNHRSWASNDSMIADDIAWSLRLLRGGSPEKSKLSSSQSWIVFHGEFSMKLLVSFHRQRSLHEFHVLSVLRVCRDVVILVSIGVYKPHRYQKQRCMLGQGILSCSCRNCATIFLVKEPGVKIFHCRHCHIFMLHVLNHGTESLACKAPSGIHRAIVLDALTNVKKPMLGRIKPFLLTIQYKKKLNILQNRTVNGWQVGRHHRWHEKPNKSLKEPLAVKMIALEIILQNFGWRNQRISQAKDSSQSPCHLSSLVLLPNFAGYNICWVFVRMVWCVFQWTRASWKPGRSNIELNTVLSIATGRCFLIKTWPCAPGSVITSWHWEFRYRIKDDAVRSFSSIISEWDNTSSQLGHTANISNIIFDALH